ncbi:CLUMA_CG006484, isoform A [Clunio marinus]|uniref:CLUMA_CG006484, isoform A n=1 Tax=Clunio marinus TaxID=568069 RepID=A0A1J1HY20_9DIPT|nr:CLUMA_CG006484, isoform A [Clunio marinus]
MENENNDEQDVLIAKIISGSGLFIVSVICGIIPFKLAKVLKWTDPVIGENGENKTNLTVTLLLSFGGGVLLATTFLHLLPEINSTITWLMEENMIPKVDVSLGEFFMMAGFFIIYLIEELVHNYLHRHQHKLRKKGEESSERDLEAQTSLNDDFLRNVANRNSVVSLTSQMSKISSSDIPAKMKIENDRKDEHAHVHDHGHSHIFPLPHSVDEDSLVRSLRGLLIVLALSIHELFEGFAVGLEKDATGVYFLFAAVSAHKFVISFCIGVELMVQRVKLSLAFIYIIIYSAVSAIGIVIGALLTTGSNGDSLQVPNVILQGLATAGVSENQSPGGKILFETIEHEKPSALIPLSL